jgi:hypothetical protein
MRIAVIVIILSVYLILAGCSAVKGKERPAKRVPFSHATSHDGVWKLTTVGGGIDENGDHSVDFTGLTIDGSTIEYFADDGLVRSIPYSIVSGISARDQAVVDIIHTAGADYEMVIDPVDGSTMSLYENIADGFRYDFVRAEDDEHVCTRENREADRSLSL